MDNERHEPLEQEIDERERTPGLVSLLLGFVMGFGLTAAHSMLGEKQPWFEAERPRKGDRSPASADKAREKPANAEDPFNPGKSGSSSD